MAIMLQLVQNKDFFSRCFLTFFGLTSISCVEMQLFDKNATISYLVVYLPFQNVNKNVHGLYLSNILMFCNSFCKDF